MSAAKKDGESPRTGPTRVLVADDHEVVREGLRMILSEEREAWLARELAGQR